MITREIPSVTITAAEIGEAFACANDQQQREVLLAFADAASKFCWAMQCRGIIDGWGGNGLTQDERNRISVALSTLMEHMDEPVTEGT
jgi:hypothetical protein